ncbi:hypothetical protein M404DRAFT_50750, partial [Pisolithus tinctorius Marx 270]
VECILDNGCQVIALRKELWEAIGTPLRPDHATVLEAANKSCAHTLGVMEDARLKIGPLEVFLQIQVIENAPFDLLLGCPFFCLLSSVMCDFPNREQLVELCDPNTGQMVLIPT